MPRQVITDRDLGWRRLGKALRDVSANAVDVGVRGEDTARSGDSATNPEIAAWHEYGTSQIPARPFMRPTYDQNWPVYRKIAKALGVRVFFGTLTKHQALSVLGAKFASDVKARIRAHIPPELDESTVQRKGSSTPLIDTGQLIRAISHKVVRR